MTSPADVLDFWFGPPGDPGRDRPREKWFRKDSAFDGEILARFGALIDEALAGGLRDWDLDLPGAVARIVVLDQFTRNAFRGQARAFAGDALALAASRAIVTRGDDRALPGVQRQFVYLPYEHSEDLAVQRESLDLFARLGRDEPALAGLLEWAQRHHEIVERFGRFPHRNAALGRTSTPEEVAFLATPGSSF